MFSGKKLREIRQSKGITLKKLGEKTGLKWQQIQALETGRRTNLTAITLRKISLALNVSMDVFYGNDHIGRRPQKPLVEGMDKLAMMQRPDLPKEIYKISLLQETMGIEDNKLFTNVLSELAKGNIIELIPLSPSDIKKKKKIYQIPGLGRKRYDAFAYSGDLRHLFSILETLTSK